MEDIRPEDVRGRAAASRLLPHKPREALAVARAIKHPWYRCQALAAVGEATSSRAEALAIANESLAAAHEQVEPNRIVTVATWPLRHLLHLDLDSATREVKRLLGIAAGEMHGLRRLHALNALLGTVAPDTLLRHQVARAYLETARHCHGWRTERTIAQMVQQLVPVDRPLATKLLDGRASNRFLRQATEAITAHEAGAYD